MSRVNVNTFLVSPVFFSFRKHLTAFDYRLPIFDSFSPHDCTDLKPAHILYDYSEWYVSRSQEGQVFRVVCVRTTLSPAHQMIYGILLLMEMTSSL